MPIYRLAPRGSRWEGALGEPVGRWPLQGEDLWSEITDAGGWVELGGDVVRDLVPDWVPYIG